MNLTSVLKNVPEGLRKPLIFEYNEIIQRYLERRWSASELSGGKFSEIVFTILEGYSTGKFSSKPYKPSNFVNACKGLESNSHIPRSFQILIPRMLPALYEIRNNRSVGHVGGDVDPNSMDAYIVVAMCSWILAELIRVFHSLSIQEAQKAVNFISERKIPLVWEVGKIKRVLNPKISLKNQILLLSSSSSKSTKVEDLYTWIEYSDMGYFLKSLRRLHKERLIELSMNETQVDLLPPGNVYVENFISKLK